MWDRSGWRAGPVIGAQLSAFADALSAAHAARERAAEVLVGNWLDAPRWRTPGQGADHELASTGSLVAARRAPHRRPRPRIRVVVDRGRRVRSDLRARRRRCRPRSDEGAGSPLGGSPPTPWRCSRRAHILEPPVWPPRSSGCSRLLGRGELRTSGRAALPELRRLLGTARPGSEPDGRDPQPGLAQLEQLAGSIRAGGLQAAVRYEGEPVGVPAGVDLPACRIVQEALTNTLRHARARFRSRIDREPSRRSEWRSASRRGASSANALHVPDRPRGRHERRQPRPFGLGRRAPRSRLRFTRLRSPGFRGCAVGRSKLTSSKSIAGSQCLRPTAVDVGCAGRRW